MTVDASTLGDVAALATALGLLDGSGDVDTSWFEDPGGHVRGMLRNQPQRDALVQFIEDVLGDDASQVTDDPGRTWVPLRRLVGTAEAGADLFLVLGPVPRGVVVSIGVRAETDQPVAASAEIRMPLVRVNQDEAAGVTFLPGLDSIDAGDMADAEAALNASVTVADPVLNRVGVTASVPLTLHGGVPNGTPKVGIVVSGLRLPGSSQPVDIALDSSSDLGPELKHVLIALLQAEAGSATGAAHDLLGMIGLLPAGGAIPPLPVADILEHGIPALRTWVESIVTTPAAMQAWIELFADLVGATALPGEPPYGVGISVGGADLDLTVNVTEDDAGGLVVTPGALLRETTAPAGFSEARVVVAVDLARIALGLHPGVTALPYAQLTARYGGDSGTILSYTGQPADISVGALHVGLGLDATRKPVFVLGAERVDIGRPGGAPSHHDVLDLTSPDALADVASEALDAIVADLLAGLGPAGQAIGVLLGIEPPASHAGDATWPQLSLPALFADPSAAVGAFLRDVVARGDADFADLLSVIPGLLGVAASFTPPAAAGRWALELADGVAFEVWNDGTPTVLHLGVRAAPAIPPLGGSDGPVVGLGIVIEGLAVTLPAPAPASTPISVSALPSIAVEVTLSAPAGRPISFGSGYGVSLQEARLSLVWSPSAGLSASFDLPGATVTVAGVATPLPPITLGADGRLTAPLDLPAGLVEQVAASALRSASAAWVQSLVGLLGLESGAFDQAGGLAMLIGDPVRFVRGLLAAFLSGDEAGDFLASLASSAAALTHGPAGPGVPGGLVDGSGTPDDPYSLAVGDGTAALEVTLWLDPDGPPVDLAGLAAALEPEVLGRWLDDEPGAEPLGPDTVAALLGFAATQVAALRDLMAGRDSLADGLAALATRVSGGDGLLPGGAPDVPGATSVVLADVTHPQLAAAIDLAAMLGTAPDPAAVVYATGPLEPPWPGLDSRTFDLTQPGLAATAFDVSRAAGEDGPWHVRLPGRAACPGGDADSQLDAQTARLKSVVDAAATRQPNGIVLVAHGTAGQAARLLASQDPGVARVVLVGVPATGLSLDVLDVPPAADALQLLRRLLPAVDPGQPDDSKLAAGRTVLEALGGAFDSALAPANDFLPPGALGSLTPPIWSVRGALAADTVTSALAAVVRAGLEASRPAAASLRRAPTALRGGVRMRVSSPPATAGPGPDGLAIDIAASFDLGLVSLTSDPAPAPAVGLTVTLARPGGWLVGGPQGVPAAPDLSRTPSLRRAELRASADLAGSGGVRAQIVLDEVNALSLISDRLVIGDGADPVTPEVRVLLGRLAGALGPATPGTPAAAIAALLAAAGLTDPSVAPPAIGLSVDAVSRLAADPAGQLRGALAAPSARADAAAVLRAVLGDAAGSGTLAGLTLGGVTAAVDLAAPTASLRLSTVAEGLELPGGLAATIDAAVDAQGHWVGSFALAPSGPPGPAGRPSLRVATGPAGATLDIHIDDGVAGLPADLSLWPLPSGSAVAGMLPVAAMLFAGQLARDLIAGIRELDPGHLDPILTFLGLLDGTGADARVRLATGLVADPGGWVRHALGGSQLDPDRVASLVDAVRDLAGLASAPHGTLPLPFGIALRAAAGLAGALDLTLALDEDAGDVHLDMTGGVSIPASGAPTPVMSIAIRPTAIAAGVQLGLDGTNLTAGLRLSNGSTVQFYPSGPGLGAVSDVAKAALPLVLDQLASGQGPSAVPAPVPAALTEVRTILGLGDTSFDPAQLGQLAADPAGELERRLAAHGPGALAGLLALAQPVLPAGWAVDTSDPQAVTLTIGTAPTQQRLVLGYTLLPPAFSVGATVAIDHAVDGVGLAGTAHVNLDATGPRLIDVTVGVDPSRPAVIGPVDLAPFARVVVGADAAGGDRVEAGIRVVEDGHEHALVATLAIGPPLAASLGTQTDGQPDTTADIAAIVTGFVIPLLADVALDDSTVVQLLGKTVLNQATVQDLLQGVLLKNGAHFDAGVLDLSQAVPRVLRLAGNVAGANPSVLIEDHLRIGVASLTSGPTTTYGVDVTVDAGQGVALTTGDIVLSVEVDSTWTDVLPASPPPGISILVLDDTGGTYSIAASPTILVNGAGIRVARSGEPLLNEGLVIDSVALYGLIKITGHGVQAAGGKLELAGLGVAVAGASGGDNGVAQGVLGNATSGGGGGGDGTPLRPQFSPSLALEQAAGGQLEWSLRAGDGAGPWWLPIQRSFGPLHIEQIGFGVDQDGGTVHALRVLFDGGLSMLGLAIDVEELSVGARWPSGSGDPPLTDPGAWSIDLAGLAVGYSGGAVSLAGALRKRTSPPDYIGVLIAHVGPYGLTVFGGYGSSPHPTDPGTHPCSSSPAINGADRRSARVLRHRHRRRAGHQPRARPPDRLSTLRRLPADRGARPGQPRRRATPMDALHPLSAYFPPQRARSGSRPASRFTCFALVDGVAVLAVSFGDGLPDRPARAGPDGAAPAAGRRSSPIELALLVRFSTEEGVLSMQAQLTDNSWLLYPTSGSPAASRSSVVGRAPTPASSC